MREFREKLTEFFVTLTFDLRGWSPQKSCWASHVDHFRHRFYSILPNGTKVIYRQKFLDFQKSQTLDPCKIGNFWNFDLKFSGLTKV